MRSRNEYHQADRKKSRLEEGRIDYGNEKVQVIDVKLQVSTEVSDVPQAWQRHASTSHVLDAWLSGSSHAVICCLPISETWVVELMRCLTSCHCLASREQSIATEDMCIIQLNVLIQTPLLVQGNEQVYSRMAISGKHMHFTRWITCDVDIAFVPCNNSYLYQILCVLSPMC